MERADKRGDSATIYKIVKIMSGLLTASGQEAPSVDKHNNLILDHSKLAKVWKEFLEDKFAATKAESCRDGYEDLGPQIIEDPLTESAAEACWLCVFIETIAKIYPKPSSLADAHLRQPRR